MAVSATDILSLTELKDELRINYAGHTSDDNLLTGIIAHAVDVVSEDTGLPLVDKLYDAYAPFPVENFHPLRICVKDFVFDVNNAAHTIKYWSSANTLQSLPDGGILSSNLGRIVHVPEGLLIYSTVGWPTDVLTDSNAEVIGSVGIDIDLIPQGIKAAVIIMARHLYSGDAEFPARSSYDRLIHPYRRVIPQ